MDSQTARESTVEAKVDARPKEGLSMRELASTSDIWTKARYIATTNARYYVGIETVAMRDGKGI